MAASERSSAARSPGLTARQAGRAAFAAATASSTSCAPARGTSARTASVAGSRTASCSLSASSYGASAIAGSETSRSNSSIVRMGPLNVFLADTVNQIVTAAMTPIVTSGA